MNPEEISERLGESHHSKNLKFENFGESQLTHLSKLQGSLCYLSSQADPCEVSVVLTNNLVIITCFISDKFVVNKPCKKIGRFFFWICQLKKNKQIDLKKQKLNLTDISYFLYIYTTLKYHS
jgi:hypothetical protein